MAAGIIGSVVGQIVGQVVSQTLGSLISQFGQGDVAGALSNAFNDTLGGALKNVINNAPLPQFIKDAANGTIDRIIGNSNQETTPECQQACEESGFSDMVRDAVMQMVKDAADEADKKSDGKRDGGGNGSNASWLEVLAGSMGDIQNKFLEKVMESRDKLEEAAGKDSKDGQKDFITAQNEFQAQMQMFKQMSELASTTIKTIGEALSTLSRKQ